jgi:hypothetical protein
MGKKQRMHHAHVSIRVRCDGDFDDAEELATLAARAVYRHANKRHAFIAIERNIGASPTRSMVRMLQRRKFLPKPPNA